MQKDPRFPRFYADWSKPPQEQPQCPVACLFHDYCYETLRKACDHLVEQPLPDPWECHVCGHNFNTDRWAFRYTVGELDRRNEFAPDLEIPRPGILCSYCTMELFGGGDREKGDLFIHEGVDLGEEEVA